MSPLSEGMCHPRWEKRVLQKQRNRDGTLYTLVYGSLAVIYIGPIGVIWCRIQSLFLTEAFTLQL
jgi:hypothetical protein